MNETHERNSTTDHAGGTPDRSETTGDVDQSQVDVSVFQFLSYQ